MKRLANRDPFKIGIVAILVGGLLGGGVIVMSLLSFGTKTYTAVLEQTAGLRPGEDVSVHGVPSGKVKSVELDGNRVRVRFTLDKDMTLGASTTAEVKVATLLGTHFLAIDPGEGGPLPDDTIPLAQTSVPFNLQDVLEKGAESVQKLDAETIAAALSEMSKTFRATTDDIGPALTGVSRLSEAVAQRTDQTGQLLRAARSVTDQLSDSSTDLVVLMRQANLVLAEVTRRREAIHSLLVQTTTLARNLEGITNDTRADLGPAFRQLNEVIATLRAEKASLSELVRTAAPALRYVANASGNGPWVHLFGRPPMLPPDDLCLKLGNLVC